MTSERIETLPEPDIDFEALSPDELATGKALDYSFQGIPAEIDAGMHSFEFTNAGKEMHMLGIIKKKSGTTESFDELLELPKEEPRPRPSPSARRSARPATTSTSS